MRRLFPNPSETVDLAAAYAIDASSHLRVNFVASVDGAATLQGRSGGLSSPADRALFHLLRSLADVVLVGAGTARAENYGGARASEDGHAPPVAIVSRALDLDPTARLFTDTSVRPIVLTVAAAPGERRRQIEAVADVVIAGDDDVDPRRARAALEERGLGRVICEGGPHLFGWLLAADAVDEVCLTLAPVVAGGEASRIVAGVESELADGLRLEHVLEEDGHLFLRYSTAGA